MSKRLFASSLAFLGLFLVLNIGWGLWPIFSQAGFWRLAVIIPTAAIAIIIFNLSDNTWRNGSDWVKAVVASLIFAYLMALLLHWGTHVSWALAPLRALLDPAVLLQIAASSLLGLLLGNYPVATLKK